MLCSGAYYNKVEIGHVEAGLRTYDNMNPYPEEGNRKMISQITKYHFAPTKQAFENLRTEGITDNVYLTGNTVIDALKIGVQKIDRTSIMNTFPVLDDNKTLMVVTIHRRENQGNEKQNIAQAIKNIHSQKVDLQIVFILHPNPTIANYFITSLEDLSNVFLSPPLAYPQMLSLLKQTDIVVTDSGGLQEEAGYLGIPSLVLREVSERNESVEAGLSKIIGTNTNDIVEAVSTLLSTIKSHTYKGTDLYGKGESSKNIIEIIEGIYSKKT